ncbi:transcription factor CP2-like protein 1 [Uloborus diversus]|uniref:transcription factor CP2-like protein 1 n=1 Tax=Uloborus diversus TaxID=327109 RepID=UPI0024099985|nr:transcription factor CP2-like protein 1 [Uloborus diversus]
MYRKTQISFLEGMSSSNQWCVPDEVHDVLSVDFDRSLSGLEVDLCTSSSNISSSVFAVPEISSRKEDTKNSLNSSTSESFRCIQDLSGENMSNSHGAERCQMECFPVSLVHGKKIRYSQLTDIDCSNSVKRFCFNKELDHAENFQTRCRPQGLSAPELRTSSHFYSSGSVINTILSQVVQLPVLSASQTIDQNNQGPLPAFQCILLAPTSISTKLNEETLTYLNQGQSYEIKIRKLGSLQYEKPNIFKSVVQVGFQERRLQYMEKEQIKEWQQQRYGERIVEIDIPLSYGILEANNCSSTINQCEFLWDPNQDIGVFLKVNCISTEFTPKKHGGEKGVPFRILIETFSQEPHCEKLHSASCQIKVFKPKGADRKHKTDREKMCKRLQSDKEKYHPQYEYTVFRDLSFSDTWTTIHPNPSSMGSLTTSPTPSSPVSSGYSPQSPLEHIDSQKKESYEGVQATSTTETQDIAESMTEKIAPLNYDSSISECTAWLQRNMFSSYVKDFTDFTGADILNLTRADLIDICGVANGIRLFNALHGKGYLTTYVRLPPQKAYCAIYLRTPKVFELGSKIKAFCRLPPDYKCEFYVSGPSGTRVILTDEVISNMLHDSLFVIQCSEGNSEEGNCIFLKQVLE